MTTTTTTIPTATITRSAFVTALSTRVAKGDMAALSLLTSDVAQSLAFAEFIQTAAIRSKTTLAALLATVDPDSLEWMVKTIPKDSPQHGLIKDAIRASRASLPMNVELQPIGSVKFRNGDTNTSALIKVSGYGHDGKKESESKGARFWSFVLQIADSPEALQSLRDAVNTAQTLS